MQLLLLFLILGCLHTSARGQWSCTQDSECSAVQGSVCLDSGACGCAPGQQVALGGTTCVDLAPYHTSPCVEDHQCSRLFTMFECRRQNETEPGACLCQAGTSTHYFHGRCWRAAGFGAPCWQDEECVGVPRDPHNMRCDGTCVCAHGYYERQRAECRKIAYAVGDGCVVDEDCQFTNGVCEIDSLRCIDSTAPPLPVDPPSPADNTTSPALDGAYGTACSTARPCPAPLECAAPGACVCPVGYYRSADGQRCNAELGSASNEDQCVGLLARVIDGVCSCPPNFFYEENMRDCVRVTRRITDSCVSDANCHTFGAEAECGPAQPPWGLRVCACRAGRAVWDERRNMCRLFVGIGESCEADSDCMAGTQEIQCVENQCTCPEGSVPEGGICLTMGLALGDTCQATPECTATPNTECTGGSCVCSPGYSDMGGYCASVIGGACATDVDCVVQHAECGAGGECRCQAGLVPDEGLDVCWPVASGYQSSCNITAQCTEVLGEASACRNNTCVCESSHHHRDGGCWPRTSLFEACSRTSQCYLQAMSDRVVCRNSLCQCDFAYPHDEELNTCLSGSSATQILGSASFIALALTYLLLS